MIRPLSLKAIFHLLLWVSVFSAALSGQQINQPGASLVVNGVDDGAFPSNVQVVVPSFVTFDLEGDALEPYAFIVGSFEEQGMNFGGPGFFNLSLLDAFMVYNGFDPQDTGDLGAFMDAAGMASLAFSATVPNLDFCAQALVEDATSSLNVRLTGTTRIVTTLSTDTIIFFEDEDDSVFYTLASPLQFAGATWNGLWVNSNGNVTFGAPDASDAPNELDMNTGPPRVALSWRDLDPRFFGRVRVVESATGVTVRYSDVPVIDPQTGMAQSDTMAGFITFKPNNDVEVKLTRSPAGAQIVGISTGAGSAGSRNLSAEIPVALTPVESAFEIFGENDLFDLTQSLLRYQEVMGGTSYLLDADMIPLSVQSIAPAMGPVSGAASLLIRGTGFGAGAAVTVGGVMANSVDVRSPDEILVLTPPGSLGLADVEVSMAGSGSDTLVGAYEYIPLTAIAGSMALVPGQSLEIEFDLGFTFPMYGVFYDSMWVNANGTLTFGGSDASPMPTAAAMNQGLPRIAVMWNDWNWGAGSLAAVHMTPYFLTAAFVDVQSPITGAPTSVLVQISHHGEIFLMYPESPDPADSFLCGISPGFGLSASPGLVDADLYFGPSMPQEAIFEEFSPTQAFDLTGLDWDLRPVIFATDVFSSSTHN